MAILDPINSIIGNAFGTKQSDASEKKNESDAANSIDSSQGNNFKSRKYKDQPEQSTFSQMSRVPNLWTPMQSYDPINYETPQFISNSNIDDYVIGELAEPHQELLDQKAQANHDYFRAISQPLAERANEWRRSSLFRLRTRSMISKLRMN